MKPRFWIERNDHVSPHIEDIKRDVPIVRVFKRYPPFALGECVAFFVGPEAEVHASLFLKAMGVKPDD